VWWLPPRSWREGARVFVDVARLNLALLLFRLADKVAGDRSPFASPMN
jgi:hypothetical protein